MRIVKSKAVRMYAFITNDSYEEMELTQNRWPSTASAGDNYKVVNFIESEFLELSNYVERLGFAVKKLSVQDTLLSMSALELGPFICNHSDTIAILNTLNNRV